MPGDAAHRFAGAGNGLVSLYAAEGYRRVG